MNEINRLDPPSPGAADRIIGLIKSAVGEVPGGSLLTEVCGWFLRSPFERRSEEWQHTVGELLLRLAKEKGVDLEDLQKNDGFIDTVMQASQVALRTSQAEKREALRNAIINSALPHSPDESERHMFIHLVDQFTPWHLRLLGFLDDPPRWFDRQGRPQPQYGITSSLSGVIEEAFSELKQRKPFYEQVCDELDGSGLCKVSKSFHTMMSADGWRASRTSERGKAFLAFIREPQAGEKK